MGVKGAEDFALATALLFVEAFQINVEVEGKITQPHDHSTELSTINRTLSNDFH